MKELVGYLLGRFAQSALKLLYICGTYVPGGFSGSDRSSHELLRELVTNHHTDVVVATDQRYTGGRPGQAHYEDILIFGVDHDNRREQIAAIIERFSPDAILTQLLWSDVAVALGNEKTIPTILRLPALSPTIDLKSPTAIIVNVRFLQKWVRNVSGRDAYLIQPTIDLARVVSPAGKLDKQLITMFNPIDIKGGHIFHEIARAMPKRRFAVVPGWHSLRRSDGSWDKEVLRRSWESQRTHLDWTPKDVDFSDIANVEMLAPREQVSEVYARTRILVVPSQWQEALARVSIEALANGIPVIGSAVGGLQEHVASAGILIKEKEDVQAWEHAIESLDNPLLYAQYSRRGLDFVKHNCSAAKSASDFYTVLGQIIKN